MQRFLLSALTVLAIAPQAHAGSIGVTNQHSLSSRQGTGTTEIRVNGSSQTTETSSSWSHKTEAGRSYNNDVSNVSSDFTAGAGSSLTRSYTAQESFTQTTNEGYQFNSSNFGHTVSTFAE